MNELSCQLLVIGAGPGGYVCAIRAAQLGVDTIIVEAEQAGGACLNVGCIPSKALIHAAEEYDKLRSYAGGNSVLGITATAPAIDFNATMGWKSGIVKTLNRGVETLLKRGVNLVRGQASFLDGKTIVVKGADQEQKIHAQNVVIATGSAPVELPGMAFNDQLVSSTGALSFEEIPNRLLVVGAGYIGLEIGIAYAKFGSAVTIVEAGKQILPQYDPALVAPVQNRLQELGITLSLETTLASQSGNDFQLKSAGNGGETSTIQADKALVAVGRKAVIDGWGRDQLVLDMDGAFIHIDKYCQTNMRGIYAIGDVTGEPMLAHRAMAQGEMVAEQIAGSKREWDKNCIPAVCFTDPEIISAGLSPGEADADGIEVLTGEFPFVASGRALATERTDGFLRIIARADNHIVVGVQGIGAGISELTAAIGLALEMGVRLEDFAATIHAHPTKGEGLAEASMGALKRAIHI